MESKADRAHFLDAMLQVPKKMLLCGNPDYLDYCADLMKELGVPMEDT